MYDKINTEGWIHILICLCKQEFEMSMIGKLKNTKILNCVIPSPEPVGAELKKGLQRTPKIKSLLYAPPPQGLHEA